MTAAAFFLGPELFFDEEDGQPADTTAFAMDLKEELGVSVPWTNLQKIKALLMAASGVEFFENRYYFVRIADAINEGDAFVSQEENEDPDVEDLFWALYQVGLVLDEEDMLAEELSTSIMRYMERLIAEQAVENKIPARKYHDAVEFFDQTLLVRKKMLGDILLEMGVAHEELKDLDPDLLSEGF